MNTKTIQVAIGVDLLKWHDKFASALDAKIRQGYLLRYQVVNLDKHDWAEVVAPFDIVIWKPANMGPKGSSYFKEKIYFLEKFMGKTVMPNFDSIRHFESKAAQSYLFKKFCLSTPGTFVSFDYQDSIDHLKIAHLPLVFKTSYGAASRNVELIQEQNIGRRMIENNFQQQMWDEQKNQKKTNGIMLFSQIFKRWFWIKVFNTFFENGDLSNRFGSIYWQEFIPGNKADLRITVIGDRFAFGFWRNNRVGDFRASGSGRLDYESEIPQFCLQYCVKINRLLNFDSMAYDILFTDKGFVINEISYAYLDTAIFNSKGYYNIWDDKCEFIKGHVWPQELWVEWALNRAEVLS